MGNDVWSNILALFTPSIRCRDRFKRLACLFAGLGHLQPLLLATTNSHYLLDRFCMERCCSSEYVSRIVTSLIFMEILSIIVVRIAIGIELVCNPEIWTTPDSKDAKKLVSHSRKEEQIIGHISAAILSLIFLGYLQILFAFLSGGRKGHMHWFYISLLIQHFLNSLIAGSIGFWEVGLALWYLVTLPMAPIVVFFYQLMVHSWIRSHGPRYPERLIVELQIGLATAISIIAALFWTFGYSSPYDKAELTNLATITGSDTSKKNITTGSVTLKAEKSGTSITLSATVLAYAKSNGSINGDVGNVNVPITVNVTVKPGGTASQFDVTITVTMYSAYSETITVYKQTLTATNQKITLQSNGSNTITVQQSGNPVTTATVKSDKNANTVKVNFSSVNGVNLENVTYTYRTFYPDSGYYISSVEGTSIWNENWDGGMSEFVEYYERGTEALAVVHVRLLGSLDTRYFGKSTNTSNNWRIIKSKAEFNTFYDKLKNGNELSDLGRDQPSETNNLVKGIKTDQYNTEYSMVFPSLGTWLPLIMQGLSVGAVGSIFPNLIPKTLVCARTTRTLSVINMFLVTLPHIFNVMLGDNDLLEWIGTGDDWKIYKGWPFSLLLYLFYILAILFAIFNIHYPEWTLSSFLRNNTWMVFLMILFTDVLNETFNAISRAGICSQKAAGQPAKKNHPCLHNKIACLMNLTFITVAFNPTRKSLCD